MSRLTLVLIVAVSLGCVADGSHRSKRQVQVIIPPFKKVAHGVSSGPVVILDTKRILIKNLRYDGAGPDAYFWVGNGLPDSKGLKIQNELGSSDYLKGYDGTRDIELTLPGQLTFNDIDYLAIYCVAFDENFGHILIPAGLNVPAYEP